MPKQKGKTNQKSRDQIKSQIDVNAQNLKLKSQILNFTHRQKQTVLTRLRPHLQRVNGNMSISDIKILAAVDELLDAGDLVLHSTSHSKPVWRCSDEILEVLDEQRKREQKAAEEETRKKAEALAKLTAEKAALQDEMTTLEEKMREQEEQGVRINP